MRGNGGRAVVHSVWDGHSMSDSQSAEVLEFSDQSWGGECETSCDGGAVEEAMVRPRRDGTDNIRWAHDGTKGR